MRETLENDSSSKVKKDLFHVNIYSYIFEKLYSFKKINENLLFIFFNVAKAKKMKFYERFSLLKKLLINIS